MILSRRGVEFAGGCKIVPFVRSRCKEAQMGDEVVFLDTHLEDDAEFAKFPPHCLKG